jgi:predicted permease
MPRIRSFLLNLFNRTRVDRELDDELQAALAVLVDEHVGQGMSATEARRVALLKLGGIESVKQQVREVRSGAYIDALVQDVRDAGRVLRRSPLFTITAVLSLGIGIAGNAIVFSLSDAYLYRSRPGVADAHRLAEVGRVDGGGTGGFYSGSGFDTFSYPNYLDYLARQTVFEGLAAYHVGSIATFGLGASDRAARVSGAYVSANYLDVLGVQIALGRGFLPEEEHLASPSTVVVISHRLWQTQFGEDPGAIGRTIRLNGRPFTIVGITAAGFNGYSIDEQSLWVPITSYPDGDDLRRVALRGRQWLMGIGRLKDGVTIDQAQIEMGRIGRDLEREHPDENRRHGVGVAPPGAVPVILRSVVQRFVGLLFGLVGLILLVACFNVAGMLLARGLTRAPELSLRLALGAARHRIMRLLVIEGVMVSSLGAAVGLAGAWAAIRVLEQSRPLARLDFSFDLGIDWRVIAFSIIVALVAGVCCGFAPARAATRIDLAPLVVRDGTDDPRRMWARSAFVIAQVAISVLLMVCALLLGRSLRNAGAIDPGFEVDGVEVVGLDLHLGGYDIDRGRAFAEALISRVEQLPGLDAAASARVMPLTGEREGGRAWLPDQYGDERAIDASQNIVTPGYFRTLGLTLISGRNFAATDRTGAPAVAIVNETLARQAWPGAVAVGKRLVLGVSRRPLEVIGVVRDAKYRTIGERPTPFFYVPAAQRYEAIMWILLRPRGPGAIQQVRAVVHDMDPDLPVVQAASLRDMTAFTLFPQRVAAWLAAIVGVTGVVLAAIGIYGVAAYHVSQRRREIGVRLAMGALREQVLAMIVRHAGRLFGVGALIGLATAALLTRLLDGMLYGVHPVDPASFAGGAIVLGVLALIATLVPALRAASINPVETLRAE